MDAEDAGGVVGRRLRQGRPCRKDHARGAAGGIGDKPPRGQVRGAGDDDGIRHQIIDQVLPILLHVRGKGPARQQGPHDLEGQSVDVLMGDRCHCRCPRRKLGPLGIQCGRLPLQLVEGFFDALRRAGGAGGEELDLSTFGVREGLAAIGDSCLQVNARAGRSGRSDTKWSKAPARPESVPGCTLVAPRRWPGGRQSKQADEKQIGVRRRSRQPASGGGHGGATAMVSALRCRRVRGRPARRLTTTLSSRAARMEAKDRTLMSCRRPPAGESVAAPAFAAHQQSHEKVGYEPVYSATRQGLPRPPSNRNRRIDREKPHHIKVTRLMYRRAGSVTAVPPRMAILSTKVGGCFSDQPNAPAKARLIKIGYGLRSHQAVDPRRTIRQRPIPTSKPGATTRAPSRSHIARMARTARANPTNAAGVTRPMPA